MAQENWQKYKLLKLLELLRQETDEQNPLPTSAICNRLAEMGISCERRTLTKDIAVLNELGYEVMWNWVGKEKGYYIEDRSFSVPELKILIDAVQAASFITEKKTAELIDKIAELGGTHKADILKSNMVCFNTRKHSNESIYYNVGFLEDAIQQQKKVIFYYYDLNDNAEQSDYAAYRSEDVLADDADGLGSKGCYRLLKAEVVNAHCTGCPYHCYEALKDHHVVEGIASLALALHGAGDDSRLGGMEAGQYAEGDGNEEYREEVTACKILTVVENALIAPDIVPDLDERIALYEQPDENTDSREQQNAAEYRVDTADDLVDGEYGRNEVVQEDNAVDDPCGNCSSVAREVKHLSCGNIAGGIDKHCTDKQQKQAYKYIVYAKNTLVGVLFDHVWHL